MGLKNYTDLERWFSSKFFLKALALVLALALWGYVVGDRNEEMMANFDVRLEFLNPPTGLVVSPSARSVSVTLMGERRVIASLDSLALASDVDLRGLAAGRYQLPVRFVTPHRTVVTQMTPSTVEVELFRVLEKQLPVQVVPPADMPEGYVMDGTTVTPDTVTVLGREDVLNRLDVLTVRPTVQQLSQGGAWTMALHLPSGAAEDHVTFRPAEVTVSASFFQGQPRKSLPVRVSWQGELPSGLTLKSVEIVPSEMSVEGPVQALEELQVLETEPLDLSTLRHSGTYRRRILSLPPELSLLDSPQVQVHLTLESQRASRVFEEVPLEIQGTADPDRWRASPSTVMVRVYGPVEAMDRLDPNRLGLRAYLDVTNVVSRSLRLPVRIHYDESSGVELAEADPSTVQVRALAP